VAQVGENVRKTFIRKEMVRIVERDRDRSARDVVVGSDQGDPPLQRRRCDRRALIAAIRVQAIDQHASRAAMTFRVGGADREDSRGLPARLRCCRRFVDQHRLQVIGLERYACERGHDVNSSPVH